MSIMFTSSFQCPLSEEGGSWGCPRLSNISKSFLFSSFVVYIKFCWCGKPLGHRCHIHNKDYSLYLELQTFTTRLIYFVYSLPDLLDTVNQSVLDSMQIDWDYDLTDRLVSSPNLHENQLIRVPFGLSYNPYCLLCFQYCTKSLSQRYQDRRERNFL